MNVCYINSSSCNLDSSSISTTVSLTALPNKHTSNVVHYVRCLESFRSFLHFKRCCSSSATAMSRLGIFAASAASCLVHGIATMPSMPWADSSCQAAPGCNALELEGPTKRCFLHGFALLPCSKKSYFWEEV